MLYGSKYGSTKRYAAWITEQTGADLFDLSEFDPSRLEDYPVILLGSPVYFGRIRHIGFIKRHWKVLERKKVAVFYVTGIPTDDVRQERIVRKGLPDRIRERVAYYPLRGAFDYRRLHCIDKLLMSWPRVRLYAKWRIRRDPAARQLLDRFLSLQDWTTEEAIVPITSFAR
ncbi:MAG: flavodoxin [Syntrophorhabdus sp. PtaB.Bin047]|nr:MAG: flavodoxin [Syntrophorhabdus sp. PtaB.Bin047]